MKKSHGRDMRLAWCGWAVVAAVICVICLVSVARQREHTVTGAYRGAVAHWQGGEDIYGQTVHGFLYLPHAAILFAPFDALPYAFGEMVWRVVGVGLFAIGVWRLARVAQKAGGEPLFPVITLLSMPLLFESAQRQMNLPLGAMMMLSAAALGKERYWQALLWLMIGLAALLALPLMLQAPGYVWQQYGLFLDKLTVAGDPVGQGTAREQFLYSDLFVLLRVWGIHATMGVQLAVRAVAALATLELCWLWRKHFGKRSGEVMLFVLAACYLMLFNPRTENDSYTLVGPAIAVFAAWALVAAILLMAGSFEITKHITPGKSIWLRPLLCSVFAGHVAYVIVARRPGQMLPPCSRV
jgi:alpha-1,2-mannosyltransferase